MSSPFPHTRGSKLGYDTDEVDEFLARAREAYDTRASGGGPAISSDLVRRTAFTMRKGGYFPPAVDAALERLEDAFALRERDQAWTKAGDEAWFANARSRAREILNRIERPDGQKFTRAGFLRIGYHPKDVDAFAYHLVQYFRAGADLSVTDVRTITFRSKRGGYDEAQVDALLDAVVDVMLAVR
ncbi:DivIVA domain-containing protein [Humibacter sp. BT305]|uniref:MFS transporter permease n=1 Tax=Cnuibacter physcomitrellae TaxID=1619308 RepID=A0A1X9LKN1_9MICO|nr:DivIVA domain-containing protein [Cnuibacter physcomitrellae]ARJ04848.1 MFS transporter permease [Cnuibacter physcomitrellae]AXH36503.1 DivIVA domain-containing protein [Humibacter sp. BT305]MCS5499052.1 DivIVA domain-containing protein [Cnuibacter physcomitrellae]GGI41746.1 hypothetical protein GCM10010988_35560 [Cnuibacter physcomitrellae]